MSTERSPSPPDPSEDEFLAMPTPSVRALVAPHRLSISMLLNGTRRLYLATQLDAPPRDLEFLPDCLEFICRAMADLLERLVQHGVYRVFWPAYSEDQLERDPRSHRYLIEGIGQVTSHPELVRVYREQSIAVRFYGQAEGLPEETRACLTPLDFGPPRAFVHFGIDSGDSYHHLFRVVHELGVALGRPPSRAEVIARYYGEPEVERLDVLIAFSRTYARLGIPPCLDGQDRIYTTAVSPLALTTRMLRQILYDHLYRAQDRGRNYLDMDVPQLQRLKSFYAQNREEVIGLTDHVNGLCFPRPSIRRPADPPTRRHER